jgi:tripartite-type tricarboxylate transporter receptor subunit TctC
VEILRMPSFESALLVQGVASTPSTPDEFAAFVRSEIVKWRKIIEVSGARVD